MTPRAAPPGAVALLSAWTARAPLVDVVHNCDLFTLVNGLAAQSVDMILADLPYGTTACTWDEVIPFEPMWAAFKRVIRPRGAIVLTASQPFTSRLVCSNLGMFRYQWVWDKVKASGFLDARRKPLKQHEDVCVFSSNACNYYPQMRIGGLHHKGPHSFQSEVYNTYKPRVVQYDDEYFPKSIVSFSSADTTNQLHPTQKPVALFEYLIRTYTQPGDVVLDPVCGSGTTAVAARNTGRRYICGDTSAEYVAIAHDRLRAPFEARAVVRETRLDDLPLFAMAGT